MKRILAAVVLLCAITPAHAQKTKAQINTEITLGFPDNTTGAITPALLRSVAADTINSIMPNAPVTTGNLACWDGTTGLLKDCTVAPVAAGLTVGTSTISPTVAGSVLFNNSGILGEYTISGTGSVCMTTSCTANLASATGLPITTGVTGLGTGVLTAVTANINASGGIITPTPVRAGDVIFWNGSAWSQLSGNNAGTQVLQESSVGVPSWATVAGTGTVQTITAGNGINLSSGATCTTTCTVSLTLSPTTASLGSDTAISNSVYTDGPAINLGASGTWHAGGTVTFLDTGGAVQISCKLWDGTTVIASGKATTNASNLPDTMSLSGNLASPAASIKISCTSNAVGATSTFKFNSSGNSKDSTISGFRIG